MKLTEVFWKTLDSKKRYLIHEGGTRSSKTYSILQYIILLAQKNGNEDTVISIVSESFPHLKRGAMRDFLHILKEEGAYNPNEHNKTDSIYNIGRVLIEFFSVDDEAKLRGASRDYLFINECNNVSYAAYTQLAARTSKKIILDYNPASEFWVHDKIIPNYEHDYVHSTYKNNKYLPKDLKKEIESRKDTDPNWWRVYGLGLIGKLEGLVFLSFKTVKSVPVEADLLAYGLDFGYTNNPSTIVALYLFNNEIYLDEVMYRKGMDNGEIADYIKSKGLKKVIYGDSAEPKSIDEIYKYGINIKPVVKGKDSVAYGIDLMQQKKINVTQGSLNLIKELRNYTWKVDKAGKPLNEPVKMYDHCIDAARYASLMTLGKRGETKMEAAQITPIVGDVFSMDF